MKTIPVSIFLSKKRINTLFFEEDILDRFQDWDEALFFIRRDLINNENYDSNIVLNKED